MTSDEFGTHKSIQVFSTCSTILFIKFWITTMIQARKSYAAGARPPEDAYSGVPPQNYGFQYAASHTAMNDDAETGCATNANTPEYREAREMDRRWKRIVSNDLETIPLGLVVFLGSILASGQDELNCVMIAIFTFARLMHTHSYANRKQPYRTTFWGIAQFCVLVSAINGFVSFIAE